MTVPRQVKPDRKILCTSGQWRTASSSAAHIFVANARTSHLPELNLSWTVGAGGWQSRTMEFVMAQPSDKLALVTGASTGIGYFLAQECANHGYDLIVAADEARIEKAAAELRHQTGVAIRA